MNVILKIKFVLESTTTKTDETYVFLSLFSIDLFNPNLFYISKHRCIFCSRLVFFTKVMICFLIIRLVTFITRL